MNIARFSIESPIYTWLIILGCLLGGIWGFNSLGRLEDPAFTIKTASVVTEYPGASAEEVAREITEPLESQIQKLGQIDEITSTNQPGLSIIEVDIQDQYDGTELPEVWTELRNKVGDTVLPDGASVPFVNDDFGDVYGLFYAVSAEGFSDKEKYEIATFLRREILAVEGVADVVTDNVPNEVIYVEPNLAITTNLGISPAAIQNALATTDTIEDAGSLQSTEGRTIIQRATGDDSVSEIARLTVGVGGELVNLIDFADVYRAQEQNPNLYIRHNGLDAFTLAVAGVSTDNIVDIGNRVDARLDELITEIPIGVDIAPIYQQHIVVDESVNDFLVNLSMSVSIVVVVLALFMGWRAAVVVGTTLLLTVVGTLVFMAFFAIEMERISLGALIIAMGMLVDNAIVVAEGMQNAMKRGKNSKDAADDAVGKAQIPLLGATVIGIMAFAGIGLSPDSTGEFLFSLFAVIGISLLLSWVLAITVTPLLGHYFFVQITEDIGDPYGGPIFRMYGGFLRGCIKARWLVVAGLLGVTVACFALFGQIRQQFFPDSNTPLFFVHYKLDQGASIHETSRDLAVLEDWLLDQEDVVAATAFVGDGAARFMLTYSSEDPNPSYGHIIVRTNSIDEIAPLMAGLLDYGQGALPQAELRAERLAFGPGGGADVAVRFSGSDPEVLRDLADEAIARMKAASDDLVAPRIDWREREQVLRPIYADDRAQEAGISRSDISQTLQFATDGLSAGVFREGDRQIPILLRAPQENPVALTDHVVYSSATDTYVPLTQVIEGLRFETQDTLLMRKDRLFTITAQVNAPPGFTASELQVQLTETIEAMELPIGYNMEWGGELENSTDSQASLAAQLPLSLIVMVLISILLFNALRQPLIIWLLVPMSVDGVSLGLLGTGLPFTFTALLGLLSLSGMLIKNGIVLVEEIDITRREDPSKPLDNAIVEASTSRLRPVVLAAATTILGMIPLLSDAFFQSMAVTIMGGLAFASVLTLIAAPVFYYLLFIGEERRKASAVPDAVPAE
ncbi:MAG: efflux RND transporter permease subunit [Pseudomonadota bacterium]